MHLFLQQADDWIAETLADDSDLSGSSTIDRELQGCSFIKEVRDDKRYTGVIRYDEQKHDELIFVEAIVFKNSEDITEEGVLYFRRHKFEGSGCKNKAARYVYIQKQEINHKYFHQ